jgi:energy-coupling factor transporter transmembrane protein EcfT
VHPLTLIAVVVWITSLSLVVDSLLTLGGLLIISVLMAIFLSGDYGQRLGHRLVKLLPLFISVFILQVIFRKGDVALLDLGWLRISRSGVLAGLQICIRFATIICSASAMVKLNYNDFRIAFSAIRLPEEIAFMVSYVIHFVPLLEERFRQSLATVRRRGVKIESLHYKDKIQLYKALTIAVLAGILSKSGLQAIALELRGFRSVGKPTKYFQQRVGLKDSLVYYVMIILSLIILGKHQSYL